MTALKDVVGLVLIAFLLPVWMVLGLGALVVVITRQLYWWARGNTSVVSRSAALVRAFPRYRAASPRTRDASLTAGSVAGAPEGVALHAAVAGMSGR
jgi:hypothetical protein